MTTTTVEKYYLRKRAATQALTTEALDRIQNEAARKAASQGPEEVRCNDVSFSSK